MGNPPEVPPDPGLRVWDARAGSAELVAIANLEVDEGCAAIPPRSLPMCMGNPYGGSK
jgi:hypothetical protein